jgi:regulation of enolase protein 1 (concanavalin A-like superfamily)
MDSLRLQPIPAELHWENPPLDWKVDQERILSITAGKKTDLFSSPRGDVVKNNSPRALFRPQDNFLLSAKVDVDFQGTFDAGVLIIYADRETWAKLCFEYSPQRQPMVVSVVNQGFSDDCNSVPIDGNQVYLRIARLGRAFAFHFSIDGQFWHLVRHFTLGDLDKLAIGFSSQAPTGDRCIAMFSEIRYETRTLKDIRSGE